MSDTSLCPFLSLIAANAVEQIKHGIFRGFRITWRSVNLHPAFYAHGFGIVIDPFEFAALNSLARFVETLRRIRKGRFVVRLQLDGTAKSATTAAFGRIRGTGTRGCSLRRCS